jgi:hypothetical protein
VSGNDQRATAKATARGRRTVRRKPESWLELVHEAIGDWSRTWRLVVLAATAAICVASVIFVIQLRPDRWQSVLAIASLVSVAVGITRVSGWPRSSSEPGDQ